MKTFFYSFLYLTIFITFNAKAQTYSEQCEKCLLSFNADNATDSLFGLTLYNFDSCMIGAMAPNFKALTIKGESIELSKLTGQVVVLNFWGTGCGPCVAEIPDLNKLVKYYSRKKVSFISLAYDKKKNLNDFLKTHPFLFKTIPQTDSIRLDVFKLNSVWPYIIIIDKENKIYKMWFGGFENSEDVLPFYKNIIDKLL